MGRFEVTQSEYESLTEENPSHFQSVSDARQRPVEQVSWHEAVAFCVKMSRKTIVLQGVRYGFRLPTEAEWEYACRAGSKTEWSTGATLQGVQANFAKSKVNATRVVGSYAANAWGLSDMHGNVWEWCLDAWDGTANYPASAVSDPVVETGDVQIFRGGSWASAAEFCRSGVRGNGISRGSGSQIGFRVVLAPVDDR